MNIKINIGNTILTIYGVITKNQPLPYLCLDLKIIFEDKIYYPYERPHILLLKKIRDSILTRDSCVVCFLNLKELILFYYDQIDDTLYFVKQDGKNDYYVKVLTYESLMTFISNISLHI